MEYGILGMIIGPALCFLGYFFVQLERETQRKPKVVRVRLLSLQDGPRPGNRQAPSRKCKWTRAA